MNARQNDPELRRSRKLGFLDWIEDFLYGYDFFIAYRTRDSRNYALELAKQLQKKYSVFIDTEEYMLGDSIAGSGNRALSKTNALVVVATPGIVDSEHVKREIREFKKLQRRIIVIAFEGTLEAIQKNSDFTELLPLDTLTHVEPASALSFPPVPAVLDKIERTHSTLAKRARRRGIIFGMALSLVGLVLAAAGLGGVAKAYYGKVRASDMLRNRLHAEISQDDRGFWEVILPKETASEELLDIHEFATLCRALGRVSRVAISSRRLAGIDGLGQLSDLRYVNLYESRGIDSLGFLAQLPEVTEVHLNDCDIDDAKFQTMSTSGKLTAVTLSNNAITPASAGVLAKLLDSSPGLRDIRLVGCKQFFVTDELAVALKKQSQRLAAAGGGRLSIHMDKASWERTSASAVRTLKEAQKSGALLQGFGAEDLSDGKEI